MEERDICAVVPMKGTASSKQRLARLVPADLRLGLALAMFEDVLAALSRSRGLSGVLVMTTASAVIEIARRYDARIVGDDGCAGHTAVVRRAARLLSNERRGGMLQIPGDIPLVTSDELSSLLRMHQHSPAFTISPSHDEGGSNAIVVSPPDVVPLTFGENSFFPHLRAARDHGLEPLVVRLPGVGRDIDTPEDLQEFARLGSATRAQRFLDRHKVMAARECLQRS